MTTTRYSYQPYMGDSHNLDVDDAISHSAFRTDASGDWHESTLLNYGDYAGDTVTRSNFDVFKERYSGKTGVQEVFSGYGYCGWMLNFDMMDSETREAIEEDLKSIEGYPLLDEDHHSNLEMELQSEAIADYLGYDITRKYNEIMEARDDNHEYVSHDTMTDRIWSAINDMSRTPPYHDVEFIFEDAVSAWLSDEDQSAIAQWMADN